MPAPVDSCMAPGRGTVVWRIQRERRTCRHNMVVSERCSTCGVEDDGRKEGVGKSSVPWKTGVDCSGETDRSRLASSPADDAGSLRTRRRDCPPQWCTVCIASPVGYHYQIQSFRISITLLQSSHTPDGTSNPFTDTSTSALDNLGHGGTIEIARVHADHYIRRCGFRRPNSKASTWRSICVDYCTAPSGALGSSSWPT